MKEGASSPQHQLSPTEITRCLADRVAANSATASAVSQAYPRMDFQQVYEGINFRVTQRGGDMDLRLANLLKAIKYAAEQQGLTEIVELLSK